MVLRHFNLREQPFGVTPDPRFLCATATHREALAALLYGVESGLGFVSLIASPGMGKTTILFEALSRLGGTVRTVFLFQSIQTPIDLFRALLIDLGERNPSGSAIDLETRLNEILLELRRAGKRLVVVLDEAQNLDFAVLEAVRMLSNFETPSRKLVQIILSGQLQLADRLAQPDLLQLRQRISIFASLTPLSAKEVENYIRHRLKVAGYEGPKPLFTDDALKMIAWHSGGLPRNINNICFNALTIGYALGKRTLDTRIIQEVIDDLSVPKLERSRPIAITEATTVDAKVAHEAIDDLKVRKLESSKPITITEATEERPSIGQPRREVHPGLRVAAIAAVLFAVSVAACVLLASSGDDVKDNRHRGAAPPSTDARLREPAPAATPPAAPVADQKQVAAPTPIQSAETLTPTHLNHASSVPPKKRAMIAPGASNAGKEFQSLGTCGTPLLSNSCTEFGSSVRASPN